MLANVFSDQTLQSHCKSCHFDFDYIRSHLITSSATFGASSHSSPPRHSILHTSGFRLQRTLVLTRFVRTRSCIHFSSMPLVPSMAVTFTAPLHHPAAHITETKREASHRTACSLVHSPCYFRIRSLDGKGPLRTLGSMKMRVCTDSFLLRANTFWLMPAIHCVNIC